VLSTTDNVNKSSSNKLPGPKINKEAAPLYTIPSKQSQGHSSKEGSVANNSSSIVTAVTKSASKKGSASINPEKLKQYLISS